jgi:S-phase kinase-associated protein 1
VEFLTHLKANPAPEIEKPIKSNEMKDNTTEWYANFVDSQDLDHVMDVTLAANYLDIKPLVDLCCAKIGTYIKGKPIPEVRKIFGIVNDFTPEEEAMEFDESLIGEPNAEGEEAKKEEEKKS